MKKFLATVLAIALMVSTMSLRAFAAEPEMLTADDAKNFACSIFPEYAEQIKGENLSASVFARNADVDLGEPIIQENREIANGDTMTYQEYREGIVIVTYYNNSELVESSTGTGYAYRRCDLFVSCNVSDEMLVVRDFEYTHVQGAYDSIVSFGTTSDSSARIRNVIGQTQETSTMKAFVRYYASFTPDKKYGINDDLDAYLQAEVGAESCSYSVVAE